MPRAEKHELTLIQLKVGTIFKVPTTEQVGNLSLTVDGVYQVSTAKADHGRNVRICDVRETRPFGDDGTQKKPFAIPTSLAKTIKVYKISN
jgi:hypothetical protein